MADISKITLLNGSTYNLKDASVPSWAKASSKPSYTANEVGAIPTTQKGTASGVAELDSNGKVPSTQLPSYVDDVLEYSAKSSFPTTGETGKIYVDISTNLTYRWSGTAYVEISPSLALGETSSTAYRGDRGKTAYDHASAKGSAYSSGLYKITTNSEGHVTAATAVAKADITALGIPGSDTNTTYSLTQDSSDGHKITLTPSSGTAQTITIPDNNTDTKVTSAANHYTPSRDTSADKSASASGATAAWSIDVVKGVTVQTDGKGHVTGVAVTSGKIPGNPNTDTHRAIQVNGTQALGNNTTALNLKAGSNVTITDGGSGAITIAATDTNTWRGIQDNLTSSSNTTESLSAKQGYLLANGSARDSTKVSKSGDTMTGPLQWTSSALPEKTNPNYFLVIDAFGDGGKTYWVGKDNAKATLLNTNATHNNTFLRKDGTWQIPPYPVTSVAGKTGTVTLAKGDVGLGNVDNTSDVNKQIYEANLLWGGKNFYDSYGPIDAAMIGSLGANRLAFFKPEGVTVEYSRDNGASWTNYGATEAQKRSLFVLGTDFFIGKADSTNKATANGTKYQLRIILNSEFGRLYTVLKKIAIYVSTNGSSNCTVTIDKALKSSPTTYTTHIADVPLGGRSGWDIINISDLITYGNSNSQNSQYVNIRFTFKANGGNTNYSGLSIKRICGFGGLGWVTPSNMAANGHLYSYDENQNATFPAKVTATSFSGPLTGNVTGNVSGTATNVTGTVAIEHGGTGATTAANARTNLGLGNVENKSSATIRGELTKANVTTALGYTPPTTDTNTWRPVSDSVSSTSSSDAASSKAVKTAYDLAASKTANTGTVTSVATGVGLTGGTITGSGTLKAKLRSETALTIDSAAATTTSGRVYPVAVDKSGYLAVNVPWISYSNATTSAAGLMSAADKTKSDSIEIATLSEVKSYLGIS